MIYTDPNLASYTHPHYRQLYPLREFCRDMYIGRDRWLSIDPISLEYVIEPIKSKLYLPREAGEEDSEYTARLSRSYFKRKFGNAVDSYAGLLSNFSVVGDLPHNFDQYKHNVDRLGNDLRAFLLGADICAIRDGIAFIHVDFPESPLDEYGNPLINNAQEERDMNLRPYFVLIEAQNVINCQLTEQGELSMLVIKERIWQKDGHYGIKPQEQYRILYPGMCEIFVPSENNVLILAKTIVTGLSFIPIVPYACTANNHPLNHYPCLGDLASLNLKLYQKESEKDELMHKCNIPILSISERIVPNTGLPARPEKKPDKLQIGSNTCLWNVDAAYVEPSGSALSLTLQDINDLEASIAQRTLEFLAFSNQSRTATEVIHTAAPQEASLATLIRTKESNVETLFRYWAAYYDKESTAQISIDEGIVQSNIHPSQIASVQSARKDRDLSRRTFLELLVQAKLLPANVSVEDELSRLKEENDDISGRNLQTNSVDGATP